MSDLYDQCRILYHIYRANHDGERISASDLIADEDLKFMHGVGNLIQHLTDLKGLDTSKMMMKVTKIYNLHATVGVNLLLTIDQEKIVAIILLGVVVLVYQLPGYKMNR